MAGRYKLNYLHLIFSSAFLRVICEKLMIYGMASNDVRERDVVYRTKRTGPSTEP